MLLIGGAITAIVGVLIWKNQQKKKTTDEGYSNLTGRMALDSDAGGAYGLGCKVCERPDGTTYFAVQGQCAIGDSCQTSIRPK